MQQLEVKKIVYFILAVVAGLVGSGLALHSPLKGYAGLAGLAAGAAALAIIFILEQPTKDRRGEAIRASILLMLLPSMVAASLLYMGAGVFSFAGGFATMFAGEHYIKLKKKAVAGVVK